MALNIPACLDGRDQLETDEVIESQSIASVRIRVDRFITRVKKFKFLKSEIPLTMHGSINQVWTVAFLLCNFMDQIDQTGNPSLQNQGLLRRLKSEKKIIIWKPKNQLFCN